MTTAAPEKTIRKANRKVEKALSVFSVAADQLDAASAQHISAAQEYTSRMEGLRQQAKDEFNAAVNAAEKAYDEAIKEAELDYASTNDAADSLDELADVTFEWAVEAQAQADKLRSLLQV